MLYICCTKFFWAQFAAKIILGAQFAKQQIFWAKFARAQFARAQIVGTQYAGTNLPQKHCQRHNGPEGWVHITRSQYTVHRHIEHITISESRLSINFKISTKHRPNLKLRSWLNLASEYWPRFNFVTSTKHQQQNTDQTSASKSRLNFNFKILTKVLKVWTKVTWKENHVSQWVSDKDNDKDNDQTQVY